MSTNYHAQAEAAFAEYERREQLAWEDVEQVARHKDDGTYWGPPLYWSTYMNYRREVANRWADYERRIAWIDYQQAHPELDIPSIVETAKAECERTGQPVAIKAQLDMNSAVLDCFWAAVESCARGTPVTGYSWRLEEKNMFQKMLSEGNGKLGFGDVD